MLEFGVLESMDIRQMKNELREIVTGISTRLFGKAFQDNVVMVFSS